MEELNINNFNQISIVRQKHQLQNTHILSVLYQVTYLIAKKWVICLKNSIALDARAKKKTTRQKVFEKSRQLPEAIPVRRRTIKMAASN